MISEQEDTARRRAKQAKAMDYDNWAEIYGKDVTYLLGQIREIRAYASVCSCAHCCQIVELLG